MSTAFSPDPDSPVGPSILRKLLEVMRECGYIQKDKKNTFHNYNYASEAAIKDRVHTSLVEHGVLPQFSLRGLKEREIIRMKDGKPQTPDWLTTADVHYKFMCVETGEFIEGTFYGCGVDPADKGLYKAITGAIKYILTSQFLIATGDDPENDEGRTQTKADKADKQRDYLASKGLTPYVAEKKPPATKRPETMMPDGRTADVVEDSMRTKPEVIRELADRLDQPPKPLERIDDSRSDIQRQMERVSMMDNSFNSLKSIEMRHAKQVAEADSALKEVKSDKGKGRSGAHGIIPLDKLPNWKKVKEAIRVYTGNNDLYKATLMSKAGCEHSNEIQTKEQASAAWDALQAELKRLGLEANRKKQDDELMATLAHANEVIGQRSFGDVLFEFSCNTIADCLALESEPLQALLSRLKACVDARKGQS